MCLCNICRYDEHCHNDGHPGLDMNCTSNTDEASPYLTPMKSDFKGQI